MQCMKGQEYTADALTLYPNIQPSLQVIACSAPNDKIKRWAILGLSLRDGTVIFEIMLMEQPQQNKLKARVIQAAEAVLEHEKSVSPLDLLQQMRVLCAVHVEGWQKGIEGYNPLERWIQFGPEKLAKTYLYFQEWAAARGLKAVEVPYIHNTPRGAAPLQVTLDGDPAREKFFRTRFLAPNLPEHRARQVEEKLSKGADLVVFQMVGKDTKCHECGRELFKDNFLFMEEGEPLCLECADLDRLEYLPRGDAALSRRAKKYSQIWAVVVRFSRTRGHYERQGLLVTPEAIARAEEECVADAEQRAVLRARSAEVRQQQDRDLVEEMVRVISAKYPGCPLSEAQEIACHTAECGSGRVGRSAAGRALDEHAIELAVQAAVRHRHTNYDELLMRGVDRIEARLRVRDKIEAVLGGWQRQ